jgi:hypothetical protein
MLYSSVGVLADARRSGARRHKATNRAPLLI